LRKTLGMTIKRFEDRGYSDKIGTITIARRGKKILVTMFLLLFHLAYAGTGSAKDVIFFYLVIIGILAIPVVIYFMVDFIRKILKKRREKKVSQTFESNENID
jgi:4-hydroxybenzoate polyprenyltransferase